MWVVILSVSSSLLLLGAGASGARAAVVTLQMGTATFSQTCDATDRSPDASVDGVIDSKGWAIADSCSVPAETTENQVAVWETAADVDAAALSFTIVQSLGGQHLLGRFRFSYTTDDRSTFADGVDTGGDVTANWHALTGATPSGGGVQFNTFGDGFILVGGTIPSTATFTVDYSGNFFGITGIRLEVEEDATLPFDGPGQHSGNGNFVLTELGLDASGTPSAPPVPLPGGLPAALAVLLAASAIATLRTRGGSNVPGARN